MMEMVSGFYGEFCEDCVMLTEILLNLKIYEIGISLKFNSKIKSLKLKVYVNFRLISLKFSSMSNFQRRLILNFNFLNTNQVSNKECPCPR